MVRPSMVSIWMNLAKDLAKRSTCKRKQVGTVVTTMDLESVLAVGYNGNARGFEHTCDSDEPGNCGCIHSEINALIKAGSREDKTLFVTMSPCKNCAKAIVNARVKKVYFNEYYRDITGLCILSRANVELYWLQDSGEVIGPLTQFGGPNGAKTNNSSERRQDA